MLSFYEWDKKDELNLRRLYRARHLLWLTSESGRLIDVVSKSNSLICVRASRELLNLAIETQEASKREGSTLKRGGV